MNVNATSLIYQQETSLYTLLVINHHAMKISWGSGGIAQPFLTSALDGGGRSAPRLSRLTPLRNSPRYPLDRRLGEPRSRLGRCGEEKNISPLSGIEPQPSSP
jgi:hypothetical protein